MGNIRDHQCNDYLAEYDVVKVSSADDKHQRRLGLVGVLSNAEGLYGEGAFGGATVTDPWEALEKYQKKLEEEENVDLVLPLCHLSMSQDKKTCKNFNFPVILSGHDHFKVDEVHHGTRILKPGQDAKNSVILDLVWKSSDAEKPEIHAETVP